MVIAGGLMKKSRSVQRKLYRLKRHKRVRKKVFGTAERPRLCIFRSNQNIYAQLIDDVKGETLVSASTLDRELKEWRGKKNIEAAKQVGFLIARRALERGVKQVVLDRGGYKYHGRVKALADSAREGGLEF
jgi:large subunit ribosomal protein L18